MFLHIVDNFQLQLLVGIRVSLIFFTFPSRYLFTIGHKIYLALEDGPPIFRLSSTFTVLLYAMLFCSNSTGLFLTLFGSFMDCHLLFLIDDLCIAGLYRVRSPLFPVSRLISSLPVTEMFHFTGFLPLEPSAIHFWALLGLPQSWRVFFADITSFFPSLKDY